MEKFLDQQSEKINEERVETLLNGRHRKIYVIVPSSEYIDQQFENKKSLEVVDADSFRKPTGFDYERFDLITPSSLRVLKNIKVSDMLEEGKSFIDVCPKAYPKNLAKEIKNTKVFEYTLMEEYKIGIQHLKVMNMLEGIERLQYEQKFIEYMENDNGHIKRWVDRNLTVAIKHSFEAKSIKLKLEEAKENGYRTVLFSDGKFDEGLLDSMKMIGLLDYSI